MRRSRPIVRPPPRVAGARLQHRTGVSGPDDLDVQQRFGRWLRASGTQGRRAYGLGFSCLFVSSFFQTFGSFWTHPL
jgi:hypothetical protein